MEDKNIKNAKIIIINGFTNEELKEFLSFYKKNPNLPVPIFATVTDNSLEMKVKDLIEELIEEDENFKKMMKEVKKSKK
ncbi:MAG TPA: DUF3783 domain-containing protein [Firmicutes bacterium]|uniref:DUF3783 domain-containing protein n=1 Tax=candidate division TA06 bacterium TaxID=2250710 RepID=A0A660S710_UNCT6|nr:MAG: hypothetical protein DRP44_05680 [candidate division TA06 bacterium]HFD04614.1 DUF3783 domain-containing protein [Bacillota bacterium]